MRTRPPCGSTLAVLALHALAWRLAVGGLPRFAPRPAAGIQRVALVPVARHAASATTSGHMPPPGNGPPAAMPASHGSARRQTPATGRDWPVYPTRPPPSATLHYALAQAGAASDAAGEAELEWRREARAFSLRLTATLAGRPPREWQGTGGFDAAGVAPLRLVERERGRDKRALSFDRDTDRVRFSGAPATLAVARGAQDRWSWIAQLAAIAEAPPRHGPPPDHWDLQVAGLRGGLERWTFRVLPPGDPPPELQIPASGLLHVLREPTQPYGLRVEAWLSPALHHLPAGLRLSTPPGPWAMSLWLRDP